MGYDLIPHEIRYYHQWCVWKYEHDLNGELKKIPLTPNGSPCSVSNPATWSSFDDCVKAALSNSTILAGIGFVFSDDPYAGIDLDKIMQQQENIQNAHRKVFEHFHSYSEWSPSGTGIHIIVKGRVPLGRNCRAMASEVYSQGRFFTFTGDVIKQLPIIEYQESLMQLWAELGQRDSSNSNPGNIIQFETPQLQEDLDIYQLAVNAKNSEKFKKLWDGYWQNDYRSQSEADFALVNILQFYTKNIEQIGRMFLLSGLGQRDKARKRFGQYVIPMIQRAFNREIKLIDFSSLNEKIVAPPIPVMPREISPDFQMDFPPGLMGEIANFIFNSAPRPVREASIAAAIILMAGVAGKAFNVSQTGLNQYILYISEPSSGKEQIASGISKLFSQIELRVPDAERFKGPATFSSGTGLLRRLVEDGSLKSMFCVTGEMGVRLQSMCAANASSAERDLKAAILDLYQKSGKTDSFDGRAYASRDNNISKIRAPAFSILGEGSPATFYPIMDESIVMDGLLPRFIVIEYKGNRVPDNKFRKTYMAQQDFINRVCDLFAASIQRIRSDAIYDIELNEEAAKLDSDLDVYCDNFVNKSPSSIVKYTYGRVRLKVLKLAALVAVGCDINMPTITEQHYLWAKKLILHETEQIMAKFANGEVSASNNKLEYEQFKAVINYMRNVLASKLTMTYLKTNLAMLEAGIVAVSDLQQRMCHLAVFTKDTNRDMKHKLNRAFETAKDAGILVDMDWRLPENNLGNFNFRGRCVKVIDFNALIRYCETSK